MGYKNIDLKIKMNKEKGFSISKFVIESTFSNEVKEFVNDNDLDFYLVSEIKGTLDIEGDGSSRKVIEELVSGKRKPKNEKEQKASNILSAMNYINTARPNINKENIMLIYKILATDIDMANNALENDLDYRQSVEDGMVKNFKTPSQENMRQGMRDLIDFINSDSLDDYPVEKSLIIQIVFIYFHPFYDFNGRTGRLLSYWYLALKDQGYLSNLFYLSLPNYKKDYIKMWDAFRQYQWNDLTTIFNFLGSIVYYTMEKNTTINQATINKGIHINNTERLILSHLWEYKGYITLKQLQDQMDLGISKSGFTKSINQLKDKKLINVKISNNRMYLASKIAIDSESGMVKRFIKAFMKDRSKSDLTLTTI